MIRQLHGMEVIVYSTLFLILFTTKLTNATEDLEEVKPRRAGGGTVGLFAFPRVGRSDPELFENWEGIDLAPDSIEDYDFPVHHQDKRPQQQMVAYPRIGRSGAIRFWPKSASPLRNMVKRGGTGVGVGGNGGMWFGPRLGRIQKRSSNNKEPASAQGDQL